MNRRKGVPCGCDADPCGCSPKKHCVKAINNVSPDPNGDFTINAGTGIGVIGGDNFITIVNTSDPDTFVEGKNIEFTPSGDDLEINVVDDPVIDGTLTVNGDIIQNGAAYETHAEKVYTTNDYIVMRDGAVGGLAVGDYSGFQVEKYDGTNDGRLVIDRDGVARVGDVGDEQPLMTRDESADMTDGALIKWDAANSKAVNEGTVGSDTKPIKIVNGVAVEITNALQTALTIETRDIKSKLTTAGASIGAATLYKWGKIGMIALTNLSVNNTIINIPILESGETSIAATGIKMFGVNSGTYLGELYVSGANLMIEKFGSSGSYYGCFFFMFA